MQQYHITLKNEKIKQYNRIAFFFIIINLAIFIFIAFSTPIKLIRISAIGAVFLITAALIIDYFLTLLKNNEGSPYKLAAEYVISMAWLYMEYWWIFILLFLLGLIYQISRRPLIVQIVKDKIIYPSFPSKKIAWSEINNIILKDGLLTIDFKNNKIIQQYIDPKSYNINEQEFNDFCRQQLNKSS